MNIAAIVSLISAGGTFLFSIVWWRISRAPGWAVMRPYTWVLLTASGYCLCDTVTAVGGDAPLVSAAVQLVLGFASLHGAAWLTWFVANGGLARSWLQRMLFWTGIVVGPLSVIPGIFFVEPIRVFRAESVNVTYYMPTMTLAGNCVYVFFIVLIGVVAVSLWQRWSQARHTQAALLFMVLLVPLVINDILVTLGFLSTPLLVNIGFFVVISGFGLLELGRFVSDAHRLEVLSQHLEEQVEERTRQLTLANTALARAEKMAALGQLAAGVGHEINNPSAVILANLSFLRETLGPADERAAEIVAAIDDSVASIERIARITRQLRDAGRAANSRPAQAQSCDLRMIVERAVADTRKALSDTTQTSVEVDADTFVSADPSILENVLANLLSNAIHAAAIRGNAARIKFAARPDGDKVRLVVEDNGPGIPIDLQHRLFEPFFTTKEIGKGTGLGLAVSLGLARAMGGDLRLAKNGSDGACFELVLNRAEAATIAVPPKAWVASHTGLRVLVIDDDRTVRDSLKRSLSRSFVLLDADGVDNGIELVRTRGGEIDVILCDLIMPAGGGQCFYQQLEQLAPELVKRTLFLTAGAIDGQTERFVTAHSDRVVHKPPDIQALTKTIIQLARTPRLGDRSKIA